VISWDIPLDLEGECSASRSCRFTHREVTANNRSEVWVSPWDSLDLVNNRKVSYPFPESKPDHQASSMSLHWLRNSGAPLGKMLIGKKYRTAEKKLKETSLSPLQSPHDSTWDRTWVYDVGSQYLTAWVKARIAELAFWIASYRLCNVSVKH
jgi:hypothetical protein